MKKKKTEGKNENEREWKTIQEGQLRQKKNENHGEKEEITFRSNS